MAHVVFLRGVNVGGHRVFRPSQLASQLSHLGAVNIGAAGTFVIREAASRAQVRAEVARRLPFEASIVICDGRDIGRLIATDHFGRQPARRDIVRFVSVLSARARLKPPTPISFPARGRWVLKILARDGQFVVGMYRREMKAISYFGVLDQVFGVPVTTRNWNTIGAIARVLGDGK